MNRLLLQLVLVLFAGSWVLSAQALRFGASINSAQWRLELSPFECKMWQPVPYYGDAVFSNRAGEEQTFFLAPTRKAIKTGEISLVSTAPVWDTARPSVELGVITVTAQNPSVKLGKKQAYQLLDELYEGMTPVFSHPARKAEDEQIELSLSSINFRKAYGQYRDCLATLLPVNFDQISRSRIYFPTAKHELTKTTKTQLDHVVQYVKADPSVTSFIVDGHADEVGRRLYNLNLSKHRAEAITQYLIAKGIDEAIITTRYHGERYPVAKNSTEQGRFANRRVTLRLERDKP